MTTSLHIHGARVWTGVPARPAARSITVVNGRVAALDADPPPLARRVHAGGRVVLPGLIDAHVHLLMAGRERHRLDLSAVDGRRAFEEAIARRHAELPADRWLIAGGWSEERWAGAGPPDKSWLRPAEARPVVCYRMDEHAVLVNDAVLARCALPRDAADPPGGRIVRGADGAPTGLMIEAAAWHIVNPIVPRPSAPERGEDLLAAQAHAHRHGLTAVGTMEYLEDVRDVFAPCRADLTLACRVTLLDRGWPMSFAAGVDFPADDRLAVIGYKAFIDGTLGSRTARMLEPYADDPATRGLLLELAAGGHLDAWARGVAAAGLSPSMHAIGDEAVRRALDVVDALRRAGFDLDRVRPRVEHAQHVAPRDLSRFAGVIASMQPLHRAEDGCFVERRLGGPRAAGSFPFRALADAGARLAFGSDWPIVSCDPIEGMRAAITGLTRDGATFHPESCLRPAEAVRAYTSGAAYALGLDDAGVLATGARGDLVILDGEPFADGWHETTPAVAATIASGRVVHDAAGLAADS